MKKNLIALLLFWVSTFVFAQEIDKKYLKNNWRVVEIAGDLLPPPEEFLMIFKFSDSIITIGSQVSASSGQYTLGEGNTIVVNVDGMEEIWEIKKLTANEFIFFEEQSGELKLVQTDEELPAVLTEIDIEPNDMPEIEEVSIETDYKGSKKTAKQLIGSWSVISIGGEKAPEGMSIGIQFHKDFKVNLSLNGEDNESALSGTWSLDKANKKITVAGDNNPEIWGIKTLDKKNLVIIEKSAGEIVMIKKEKEKKKK